MFQSMDAMMLPAVIRKEGRLYVAWNPDLDIASQGKHPETALANLKQAVELYLEDEDAEMPTGSPMVTMIEVHDGSKAPGSVGA
jgi:predicted RNase H-like HicB family nuclease